MPFCTNCGCKIEYCPCCGEPLAAVGDPASAPGQQVRPMEKPAGGEQVLWEGKPHVKAGIKSQTLTYKVTSERVQVVHSGISRKVEEIELARLKDVKVDQSLAQRALKLGNVVLISSDPSSPVLTLEEVAEPESVKEIIRTAARSEMDRLGVRRLANW